jgi:hypothetical protein
VFDPVGGGSSQYDNLPSYTAIASNVFDVQTNALVNLSSQISLAGATYGDFGVYGSSLVISAESNNWDFVVRLTYGSSGGLATVLVASPASDGLSASPEGVAVDSQGTVLTTLPYKPAGSSTAIHVPVGFNLLYDIGNSPAPFVPTLGLTSAPSIDSAGITVDSENNFILAVTDASLYGGGAGIAHINSALTAFLADPTASRGQGIPYGITYQNVGGSNYLAFTVPDSENYIVAGELPLFSGQVTPAQVRHAYGIDQITFAGSGGSTVTGDGTGQTIAIVEEGVDPTLQADLTTFDQFFGIPAPPSFQMKYQGGVTTENLDIVGEASLDVEWAHAIAPGASMVVYNAAYLPNDPTTSFENLLTAMQLASKLPGVSVVTLSYTEDEASVAASGLSQQSFDSYFTTPGVTFLAAAGDSGIYGNGGYQVAANYPAASPNIVSVGGTSITIDPAGDYPGTGSSGEVAWGDGTMSGRDGGGGGGLSAVEAEPAWQTAVVPAGIDPSGTRALPDVSMDSGSAQQYAVFTSTLGASSVSASAVGWLGDAGTSAASPIWAGLIAIADQGRALAGGTRLTGYTQTLPALYSLPAADYHDVVYGNNGDPAGTGYDLATGLGTPVANLLVPDLAGYQLPSKMSIQNEPPASVLVGNTFGLTVGVEDSLGNPVSSGSVTVSLGANTGGATLGGSLSEPIRNGVATFTDLTLSQPGTGYTLTLSARGIATSLTTSTITVKAGGNATQLAVSSLPVAPVLGQTVTLQATVSIISPGSGVPTGTVVFKEGSTTLGTVTLSNGVAALPITPSTAGTTTISISYGGDARDLSNQTTMTLTVAPATPTIIWPSPSNILAGTPLGATQLDAVATFDGVPVPGVLTYSPPVGTVLPSGNGQRLSVSFSPNDTTDFKSVNDSVQINVIPQLVVIGEEPVFKRKLNKHGNPVGPAIVSGFTLEFNMPLSSAAASNRGNYELDTVTFKKVQKTYQRAVHPTQRFTVTYSPATDSVTLKLTAAQAFPTGGQLKVLPGLAFDSGSVLGGITVFTITPRGKAIAPS